MRGRKIGMNLKSLTIPDQLSELGPWLDQLLVSPELINTIVELEILAGDRLTTVQSLDGVLAGSQEAVLESGLGKSAEATLRALLRQPSLLLELQERVMMHGGDYWQKKVDAVYGTANTTAAVSGLGTAAGDAGTTSQAPRKVSNVRSAGTSHQWNSKRVVGMLAALAAALLVMVSVWQPWSQSGPGASSVAKSDWGFSKSGLLKSNLSEDEMLSKLAAASQAWHNKTPSSAKQLEKRLLEFDGGCKALLASTLPQLSKRSRDKVHQACRECREDIATQLAAIQNGQNFETIRANANAAIDTLTQSIETLI